MNSHQKDFGCGIASLAVTMSEHIMPERILAAVTFGKF